MNQTTFFYCNCGYEKALNEGEDYIIVQCQNCNTLNSTEKKLTYYTVCEACGDEEKLIGEEIKFESDKKCKTCGISGEVGFKEFNQHIQFSLESKVEHENLKCERCNKKNFLEPKENTYHCPNCYSILRQKMSNTWKK